MDERFDAQDKCIEKMFVEQGARIDAITGMKLNDNNSAQGQAH
jgi:hypothetical protein